MAAQHQKAGVDRDSPSVNHSERHHQSCPTSSNRNLWGICQLGSPRTLTTSIPTSRTSDSKKHHGMVKEKRPETGLNWDSGNPRWLMHIYHIHFASLQELLLPSALSKPPPVGGPSWATWESTCSSSSQPLAQCWWHEDSFVSPIFL